MKFFLQLLRTNRLLLYHSGLYTAYVQLNACVGASDLADKTNTTVTSSIQEDGSTGTVAKSKLGH